MAVDGIACRAGVLAGHAARLRALRQEAGLVDDQHAIRITEVVDHIIAQIVAHPVSVPGRSVQEALHTLCAELPDRLGELPAVLALDPIEQAG